MSGLRDVLRETFVNGHLLSPFHIPWHQENSSPVTVRGESPVVCSGRTKTNPHVNNYDPQRCLNRLCETETRNSTLYLSLERGKKRNPPDNKQAAVTQRRHRPEGMGIPVWGSTESGCKGPDTCKRSVLVNLPQRRSELTPPLELETPDLVNTHVSNGLLRHVPRSAPCWRPAAAAAVCLM